jgi:hypothetical protein
MHSLKFDAKQRKNGEGLGRVFISSFLIGGADIWTEGWVIGASGSGTGFDGKVIFLNVSGLFGSKFQRRALARDISLEGSLGPGACTIKLYIFVIYKKWKILPQASAFLLSVTITLVLTNTLAYYRICRLQIHNVFIVQAPGVGEASAVPVGV